MDTLSLTDILAESLTPLQYTLIVTILCGNKAQIRQLQQ